MIGVRKNMEVLLVALLLGGTVSDRVAAADPVKAEVNTTTPSSARVVHACADETGPPADPIGEIVPLAAEPLDRMGSGPGDTGGGHEASAAPRPPDPSIPPPTRKDTLAGSAADKTIPATGRRTPWYRNGMVALGGVLAVMFGIVWLLRRYVPSVRSMGAGPLKVVARTHLSPKQSVALLQVGRRHVLVGVTPDHLTNLGHIADPDETFNLRARTSNPSGAGQAGEFDTALETEAAQYVESWDARVDRLDRRSQGDSAPDNTAQLQQTMGELRGLLGRLRGLQEREAG